jgi:hypothetical protein
VVIKYLMSLHLLDLLLEVLVYSAQALPQLLRQVRQRQLHSINLDYIC